MKLPELSTTSLVICFDSVCRINSKVNLLENLVAKTWFSLFDLVYLRNDLQQLFGKSGVWVELQYIEYCLL